MRRQSTLNTITVRTLIGSLLITCCSILHTQAQTLLYDFKFNNNLNDEVNNASFVSTLVANSTNYGFTDDRYNSSNSAWYNLNVVKLAANLPLLPQGNASRTIAFWVNQNANPAGTTFLWSYGTAASNQAFGIRQDFTNFRFYAWGNDNTTTAIPYDGGNWKHVAISFDGSALRMYLNGTQVYSVAKTLNTTGTTFRIGVAVDDFQLGMLARIDDLKIYSGALTPAEILVPTQQPGNPNIGNLSEQNITPFAADIHFDLSPNGSANTASVVYGTDQANLLYTTTGATYSGVGVNNGMISLSNLSPVTKYYYKIKSVNPQGTFYSSIDSFFTLSNGAPVNGLLGYYNFENNLNAHNNVHNFSIPSGWNTPTYIPNGKVGKGIQSVDYNTICVNTSMAPHLANTDFTYSFWHQMTELSSGNSPYPTFVESFSSLFWRYGQQSSMNIGMASSATTFPVFVSNIPTLNEWVHITIVKKQESNGDHNLYLYTNGNLYQTFFLGNGTINMYQFNNVFALFGGTEANGTYHFQKKTRGIMDEFYVYNRALTPTEVLLIYHNTNGVLQSTPLPVVFESVNVRNQTNHVAIDWKVSNEENLNRYLVQRSADQTSWQTIAEVNAIHNRQNEIQYDAKDEQPLSGTIYYRVVAEDMDGKEIKSSIRYVIRTVVSEIACYPNPAQDYMIVQTTEDVQVIIRSVTGQVLKTVMPDASHRIYVGDLMEGAYWITIQGAGTLQTEMMRIQR